MDGRVLLHVGRDVGHLARLVRPEVRPVEIEEDVRERGPQGDRGGREWCEGRDLSDVRSGPALEACGAGQAGGADRTGRTRGPCGPAGPATPAGPSAPWIFHPVSPPMVPGRRRAVRHPW